MKRHEILISSDIREHYVVSPENRKSATIIEMINAAGDYPSQPMVIIQGQDIIASWFSNDLSEGTSIVRT
jgi:hypothetical protein